MPDRLAIKKALLRKKAKKVCHRCGKKKFTIVDGFGKIMLRMNNGQNGYIEIITVICENCGAITNHASQPLGIEEIRANTPTEE